MKRFLGALVALLMVGPAAAAEREFVPVPSEGQEVQFEDGEAFLVTQTDRAVVMVAFVPRDKKSAWVKIGVKNVSDQAFNISDASVAAASAEMPLTVMTYADRIKEQQSQERWAAFAAGLSAASNNINAANAGYQQHYGTYGGTTSASVYGSNGTAYGTARTSGSYFGTTYDAGAVQRAQLAANAQNQAIFDRQRANAEFARRDLKDRALKANTLSPGEFVMGDVRFSLPKRNKALPVEFTVTIDVAGQLVPVLYREQQ